MISPPIVGVVALAGVGVRRALAHDLVTGRRVSAREDERPDDEADSSSAVTAAPAARNEM